MTAEFGERTLRRSALIAATSAAFLVPFVGSSVNVALPAIGVALGMDAVALSWVTTVFLLTSAVCLVPLGRIADLVGRKRIFLCGMALFTLAALGCGLARSATMLIAFRALQGVGGAMIYSTGLAILTSVFPPGARGRVIGLNAAVVYVGLSIGPFVGGLLTRHWGWPNVFLASVPIGVAAMALTWFGLKGEWRSEGVGRFDAIGSVIYGLTLIALMTGLAALPAIRGLVLTLAGLGGAFAFVYWEKRVAHPVLEVGLLVENAVFARSNLAALINYSATFSVAFLVSLYLQYVRGLDPAHAGWLLLTQPVVMAIMSPFAGWLSDRVEPRFVASAGMTLSVGGLLGLAFVDEATPRATLVGVLALLGVGFGLFASPNTNAVMSSVTPRHYGVASATLGTMRLLGQMVSMGSAAAVLAFYVGHATVTPALHGAFLRAMHLAFLLSAGWCSVGIIASFTRGNVRPAARPAAPT